MTEPVKPQPAAMNYLKLFAQVAATAVAALAAALDQGPVTKATWINVVILGLGAVAVLGAGNLPAGVWAYTKTIVSAASAAAVVVQSAIVTGGHVTPAEWMQAALAGLGALGVYAVAGPRVMALKADVSPLMGPDVPVAA